MKGKKRECMHLKATHYVGATMKNHMFCPDCDKDVPMEHVIEGILKHMKDMKK